METAITITFILTLLAELGFLGYFIWELASWDNDEWPTSLVWACVFLLLSLITGVAIIIV